MTDKSGMPEVELPSARNHGSGSGTTRGYKVEVRTSYWQPTVLGDFVIDGVWRTLQISAGAMPYGANIPVGKYDGEMLRHGLVGIAAAEAHRWALLAYLDALRPMGSICIETRIVEVELATRYSMKEIGVSAAMSVPRRVETAPRPGTAEKAEDK